MDTSTREENVPREGFEGLQVGDTVACADEYSTAAVILSIDDYCASALIQLGNGDKVDAGLVQLSDARRFVAGERRPWHPVSDARLGDGIAARDR